MLRRASDLSARARERIRAAREHDPHDWHPVGEVHYGPIEDIDPDDLEDADELLEEIESLEPAVDLTEAVEGLVRATLLLADVSRPVPAPRSSPRHGSSPPHSSSSPRRRGPTRSTR